MKSRIISREERIRDIWLVVMFCGAAAVLGVDVLLGMAGGFAILATDKYVVKFLP